MLTKIGRATFKCSQCGNVFDSIYTEGGFIAKTNLPHCPKCGTGDTEFKSSWREFLRKLR